MTLCALSLGHDASFVAMHHTLRILAITTVAPLAFRVIKGGQAGGRGEEGSGLSPISSVGGGSEKSSGSAGSSGGGGKSGEKAS